MAIYLATLLLRAVILHVREGNLLQTHMLRRMNILVWLALPLENGEFQGHLAPAAFVNFSNDNIR